MKNNNLNKLVLEYRKNEKNRDKKLVYSFLSISFSILIRVLLGIGTGLIVDGYLHTKPTFIIVITLIGFLSGLNQIFKN
jgi:F0F1-type ATP synthase assembly protein I